MVATAPTARPAAPWKALSALFCVSLIWGGTFVWMKDGMAAAEHGLGPESTTAALGYFLALRFGLAAILVAVVSPGARRGLTRDAWTGGLWLGSLLFAGFALQMVGLGEVSPAVSAFLTSLYVVFTAAISTWLERRRPRAGLVVGAVLATVGAGLIRGRPELSFSWSEWLTIASAFLFGVHILATDRVTRRVEAMPVTFTSFVVVAVASLGLLAWAATSDDFPESRRFVDVLATRAFWMPLVLTTVLATVVALTFMNVFQKQVDPVRAAILYALEPIWASIFGIATGHDTWTVWLWVGGLTLLAGNLIAELWKPRSS